MNKLIRRPLAASVSVRLLLLALCLSPLAPARAQLGVQLSLKRRLFLVHEAIVATVTLTNTSGRDITLEDTPELQWFGFQINGAGDRIIPPRNPDYHIAPVEIRAGESVRRSVNLNELYEFGDYGTFKIRAAIYDAPVKRYFTSKPVQIVQTEGRPVWRQAAGVPDGQRNAGRMHVFTLLSHQQDEYRFLYVRVEDQEDGTVFCTIPLARILEGVPPQAEFDGGNNLHVLQLTGLRAYVLTKIGVNGNFMGTANYTAPKTRPTLRKLADGTLQIIGGKKDSGVAQAPASPPTRLSDRPVGLPP